MSSHDELDPVTARRAERLSALLAAEPGSDAAARASAERMRPAVLEAARRAERTARRRSHLKAAAILLVTIGVVAVPPARAWVVDNARQLVSALGLAWTDAAPNELPPSVPVSADVSYSFDVAGPILVVRIDAHGDLVLRRVESQAAAVESVGAPGTRVVVLPDGVSIIAAIDQPGARFTISVPPHVSAVRLVLPDGSTRNHPVGEEAVTVPVIR